MTIILSYLHFYSVKSYNFCYFFFFFLNLAVFYIGENKKKSKLNFTFFLKCKNLGRRIRKPRNKKKNCLNYNNIPIYSFNLQHFKNDCLMKIHVCILMNEVFSYSLQHMSRFMRKPALCICKNKGADQLHGTAKLISAFVFTTKIVQFLYFLLAKISSP